MATATASSTSSTAVSSGQGADDNYAATGQPSEATTAGGPTGDPNSAGSQGGSASSGGGDSSSTAATEGGAPQLDDSRLSEPVRAERSKSNQLEKEIRTLRQQLNRFSEINPEEYGRLQEAERPKQILEQQMELRERQMEEASTQKVAAVAAERDEAKQQILQLRKDRLLEPPFSQAEGPTGGDARGTFFAIFKGQLGTCFRLTTGG